MSQIRATKGQKCVGDAKHGGVYDFHAISCNPRRGFGLLKDLKVITYESKYNVANT